MIRITPEPLIFVLYRFCFFSMEAIRKSYSNGAYSEAVNTNLSALQNRLDFKRFSYLRRLL